MIFDITKLERATTEAVHCVDLTDLEGSLSGRAYQFLDAVGAALTERGAARITPGLYGLDVSLTRGLTHWGVNFAADASGRPVALTATEDTPDVGGWPEPFTFASFLSAALVPADLVTSLDHRGAALLREMQA